MSIKFMRMYTLKVALNWPNQVTAQVIAHTTVDILLTSERMTDYITR